MIQCTLFIFFQYKCALFRYKAGSDHLVFCVAININEFYTTNGIAYQNKSEKKLKWTACIPWSPLHNLTVRETVF